MVINYGKNSGVFLKGNRNTKNWKINNHILFILSYFTLDNLLLKKNNGLRYMKVIIQLLTWSFQVFFNIINDLSIYLLYNYFILSKKK